MISRLISQGRPSLFNRIKGELTLVSIYTILSNLAVTVDRRVVTLLGVTTKLDKIRLEQDEMTCMTGCCVSQATSDMVIVSIIAVNDGQKSQLQL